MSPALSYLKSGGSVPLHLWVLGRNGKCRGVGEFAHVDQSCPGLGSCYWGRVCGGSLEKGWVCHTILLGFSSSF